MPAKNRHRLKPERLVLIALVAVIGYLAWDKWQADSRLRSPEYLVELANGLQQEADTGRHAQMILETRALAKEELLRLQSVIESVEDELGSLKSDAARLDALLEQIRTTSKGSVIAADRESLSQFHAAASRYSLSPGMLVSYQQTLDALREPIEAAIAEGKFDKPPAADLGTRLRTLRDTLTRDASLVESTEQQVNAALAAAPEASDASATSVADALAALEQQWAAADALAAAEQQEKVRKEYREKFAAQQAQLEREKLQTQLDNEKKVHDEKLRSEKLAAEQEARRIADAAQDAQREEARRIAERDAQLKREAQEQAFEAALPKIREYLVPFISDGNTQPRERQVQFESSAQTGPVSLSKLKAHGVLKDSAAALFNLHALGAGSSNDRPTGSFPPYYGGSSVKADQVPFFQEVQALLREHGDMMVEKRLLLP